MTSALEQEAAEQGAVPFPPYSSIEFSPIDYQKVTVFLSGDEAFDSQQIQYALRMYWAGHRKNQTYLNEYAPSQPPQEPVQSGGWHPQGQPQGSRNYPPQGLVSTLSDDVQWTCDKCGGTGDRIARRQQKGNMPGDSIVCLNPQCKEGQYRYTITMVQPGTSQQLQR